MMTARKSALALMIVLGVFCLALVASLVATYLHEKRLGVLEAPRLTAMKEQLALEPENEQLREEIRRRDLELRTEYYRNRRRFEAAAWMLLLAGIGFFAGGRWFLAAGGGAPKPPRGKRERDDWKPGKAVAGFVVMALAGAAVLCYLGTSRRPDLPSPPGPTVVGGAPGGGPERVAAPQSEEPGPAPAPIAPPVSPGAAWPGFRGVNNLGLADGDDYPTTWSLAESRNIAWAVETSVEGKSSPIVWGDRIVITGASEEQQVVACFDLATGDRLWQVNPQAPVPPGQEDMDVFPDTGFAAPTPVTDGERVIALFANGLLVAFDLEDGRQVWFQHLGVPDSIYGFASSPILHENVLIVQYDQGGSAEDGASHLFGISPKDGAFVYRTPRPVPNSWASPSIIAAQQRAELVTCAAPWAIAYDPLTGEEYWRADVLYGDVAASPAWDGTFLFTTNDQAQLSAIEPGGAGDVTDTAVKWIWQDGLPDTSSPVAGGGYVLEVAAGGMLSCLDAATGDLQWEEYLESGTSSSPILAAGRVYLSCDNGATYIFAMGPEFAMLSTGDVGEPVHATPAFVEGRIYIRTEEHLVCVAAD